MTLANNQDVVMIDTVGFIRKLPHLLVAAFKSTLEEAMYADILLHIIDVTHPHALDHADVALKVLDELHAGDKPIITVLNKVDAVEDRSILQRLRIAYPKTVQISAKTQEGFEDLQEAMIQELQKRRATVRLRIPQSDYAVASEVMREGKVLHQDYEGNDVLLHVDIPRIQLPKLERYLEAVETPSW